MTAWLEYRGSWCKTTRPAILSLVVLGHRNEKRVFLPGELLPRVWLRRRSRLVGLYNSLDGTAQHYTLPRIVIIVVSCCVIELHSVAAPQRPALLQKADYSTKWSLMALPDAAMLSGSIVGR